jgi:hypothetical protein
LHDSDSEEELIPWKDEEDECTDKTESFDEKPIVE